MFLGHELLKCIMHTVEKRILSIEGVTELLAREGRLIATNARLIFVKK